MTTKATLTRFREYMVGPFRFMNLVSCFELGVFDALRESPALTAAQLADAAGTKADSMEQLLQLPVKERWLAYDEDSGAYSLGSFADLTEGDLRRVLNYMNLIKYCALRQVHYLTESVQTGTLVGLKELYGFDGTLYDAVGEHKDLRKAFANVMDNVTQNIDPWFFDNIDIPAGAKVLDVAGHTGLGAIHTYNHKASPGLKVTTFDLPEKETECLENFRANGVAEHCSFVGGDVFKGLPEGYDVVLIKHFLDMWDKAQVVRILEAAHKSLNVGGTINIMVPVYPENIKDRDNYNVDFFPVFFLGGTMGQGGPQKLSTYKSWLEECGFTVTKAITKESANLPPDVIPVQGILSGTKTA